MDIGLNTFLIIALFSIFLLVLFGVGLWIWYFKLGGRERVFGSD
jgi:hypothetical protein